MTVPFASLLFEEIANNLKKHFLRRLTFHSGLFFFSQVIEVIHLRKRVLSSIIKKGRTL